MNIPNNWIIRALHASIKAGEAIMKVYQMDDPEISLKKDHSPITLADKRADTIIKQFLQTTNIPVLSEESSEIPYPDRKEWAQYWLVDPLDGTKEFIHRNDEFTVNIALIKNNTPVFGIIYLPVYRQLYFALQDRGAYRMENISAEDILQIHDPDILFTQADRLPDIPSSSEIRVAVSRSHLSPETKSYIREKLGNTSFEMISAGSSLKFCRVAEGEADFYPRLGPTMEWDIAAGVIIVTETGGIVRQYNGKPLLFNREDLLNPWFVVASHKMKKTLE